MTNLLSNLITSSVRRLSDVKRFATRLLIRQENVAEHSYFVAFNAMMIGKYLVSKGVVVNFENLLSRALLHDIDECVIGDLLHNLKANNDRLKKEVTKIQEEVILQLEQEFSGIALYEHWLFRKAGDIEGQIIMIADSLATLAFVKEDIAIGNKSIEFIANAIMDNEFIARIKGDSVITNKELRDLVKSFCNISYDTNVHLETIFSLDKLYGR